MRARNNLIVLGILSAIVVVFLTMQLTPGIYAVQKPVYKVYYGQLHSHTYDSDGHKGASGTPAEAYAYARDIAGLDFFSVADHCSYPYGLNESLTNDKYTSLMATATALNQETQDDEEDRFVTFWGFEWTSDDTSWGGPATLLGKGHITIINSPDFCKATGENTNDLNELEDWMSSRDCVAFFNHPGQYGYDFDKFLFNYSDKIVGMELWNRDDDYYDTNYYGNGSWNDALGKGWYIGAAGSQDNHDADWGTLNEWRMAVLAQEKTRRSIYAAMKARRFYSTRDQNLELSFTCNGAQMGSKITGGRLNVVIEASDGDGEIFSKIWLFKNGKKIKNWNPNITHPVVTTTVNGTKGDYFYVLVEQSGEFKWAAISSPIFINKYK
jgi:hypothetical protein